MFPFLELLTLLLLCGNASGHGHFCTLISVCLVHILSFPTFVNDTSHGLCMLWPRCPRAGPALTFSHPGLQHIGLTLHFLAASTRDFHRPQELLVETLRWLGKEQKQGYFSYVILPTVVFLLVASPSQMYHLHQDRLLWTQLLGPSNPLSLSLGSVPYSCSHPACLIVPIWLLIFPVTHVV